MVNSLTKFSTVVKSHKTVIKPNSIVLQETLWAETFTAPSWLVFVVWVFGSSPSPHSFTAELAVLLRAEQTNISLRYELMSLSNYIHYLSNLLFHKSVCKKLRHISKACLNSDQLNMKIVTTAATMLTLCGLFSCFLCMWNTFAYQEMVKNQSKVFQIHFTSCMLKHNIVVVTRTVTTAYSPWPRQGTCETAVKLLSFAGVQNYHE